MSKINLLSIVLITALLGSCGFHTPYQNTSLNATVSSTKNNAFATELKKHLNPVVVKSLIIEIGKETQKKQAAAYDTTGQISSYTLSLSVPIKVFDTLKQPLFTDVLTNSTQLQRVIQTQADRLQINEHYNQLRETLIKRLLRKLKRL